MAQLLEKVAKTLANFKNTKIFIPKLNLKVQIINIKPIMKHEISQNKPCFEAAYLGKNVINLRFCKAAKNVAFFLGYFIFSKKIILGILK
jgi:hypothetical protein